MKTTHSLFAGARPGLALTALCAALASPIGCSPGVPDNPTWTEDVRPILMANCARCHTDPPIQGAPPGWRLDVYDDWPLDDGTGDMGGAGSFAPFVKLRATGDAPTMPPQSPLTGRQQDILALWAENGAPHGDPLPGNQGPDMSLEPGVLDAATMTVRFAYEIRDPDGEFVVGALTATGLTETLVITNRLHSGPNEASWNIAAVTPGSYQLSAELDDGNERFSVDLGTFDVPIALAPGADVRAAGE